MYALKAETGRLKRLEEAQYRLEYNEHVYEKPIFELGDQVHQSPGSNSNSQIMSRNNVFSWVQKIAVTDSGAALKQ